MTIIGDNYGEINTETGERKTIADIEREYFNPPKGKLMFPYSWTAGVITQLSAEKVRDLAKTDKPCAICGKKKALTHANLSGGQTHHICEDCAVDYVLKAESVKIKYEQKKPEMIINPLKTLQITIRAIDVEDLKSTIEEWAAEYGTEQMKVEVL